MGREYRTLRLTIVPLIILAAFFSGSSAAGEEGDYGDAIVTASISDARNLIPILASDSASAGISSLVFNGLVKYDKDINIVGDLAENWEVLEGGLTIVFHLRRGVAWHDGKPFTARDVEFTYKKLIDPAVRTPYSGDFERVKSLEIVDDYTVRVTYKEPFAPGLASWGMGILPKHLLEREDLNRAAFGRHPVGTGPYKFRRWRTAELIELVANEDYFEGRPHIDRYIYRIIPDEATIFLELQTEGVDEAGLTPLEFLRQTETKFFKEKYNKFRFPSFSYVYMGYSLKDPRFEDIRVRRAINYAVNKDEIVEGVLSGLGRVSTGPFIPESWAYNRSVAASGFDPAKARSLLTEAGWLDSNGDGWLEKDGRIFEFTILTNQGNLERQRCAEIIERRLKDVGIKVRIKVIEWSVFINEFVNKRDFDAVLLGWSLGRDPDCYDIWHSSKTRPGEFNFIGYKNEEVDRLLVEGRRTFDESRRAEIYHKIHGILYEDQPCLFLYVPDNLEIVHKRFKGIEVSPIGIGYNFIKWYVPKREQKYKF